MVSSGITENKFPLTCVLIVKARKNNKQTVMKFLKIMKTNIFPLLKRNKNLNSAS